MPRNGLFFLLLALPLISCANKPFQPNLPLYKVYVKSGVGEDVVKETMLKCGYPNAVGNGGNDTLNEKAERQICMNRNGFKRSDGLPNICSSRSDLPACQITSPKN